jgi:hypothetical protein
MGKKAIIIFFSTFFLCIFLFIFYLHQKAKFEKNNSTCLKNLDQYKLELYSRDNKLEKQLFSEYISIDSSIIVSDMIGNEISLKELVRGPKLVYSFTRFSCTACVQDDLEIINRLGDIIGSSNIIIISRFDNLKELKIFAMQNISKSNYYNSTNKFKISLEEIESESPFFFIISRDLKIQFAHISIPGIKIENYYFKRIIQFFNCK